VDGKIMEPRSDGCLFCDPDPDDIHDIEVLTGPAAVTLYGSRGAYGVVVITTKRGAAARSARP
jgi:TonB-dependent SusC/RagA subfamily outer membrane receptor